MLYVFFMGCQSSKETSYIGQDIGSFRDKKVSSLTLKNGEVRKYDKIGGRYYEEKRDSGFTRQIVGLDPTGASLNVDISRILEVQCQAFETDGGGTVLTTILIIGGGLAIVFLLLAAAYSGVRFN
jgi:hypothetical protein